MTSDQGPNYSNQLSKHAKQHARDGFDPLQDFFDEYDAEINTIGGLLTAIGFTNGLQDIAIAALQAQVPLSGRNGSNFDKTSNASFSDVTGLGVAVAASTTYQFTLAARWTGSATGSLVGRFSVPAGTVGGYTLSAYNGTDYGPSAASDITGAGAQWGALGQSINDVFSLTGTLTTGSAGTVQFQAAQATSNGTTTRIYAGATLVLVPVA